MTDFAEYTDYTRTANAAMADGLRQSKEITLATVGVLQSLTSVLVPLSVAVLPRSQKLVSTLDTVVDRSFDAVVKVVESQYQFGAAALDLLASAPSTI